MKKRVAALLCIIVALLTIAALLTGARRESGGLRVTFLNVGEGDATVIETPSGKCLVFDTGPLFEESGDDQGRRVVAPYLRLRGIRRIDALILSHAHSDHIGGAISLLRQFPTSKLIVGPHAQNPPLFAATLREAKARQVAVAAATRGEVFSTGDGVTVQVEGPAPAGLQNAVGENEACLILRVNYGATHVLITGDADEEEEQKAVLDARPLGAQVLRVGHHGSRTSTCAPFLAAVHPTVAIISVGRHNLYHHPSPQTLDRLQAAGVKVFRTDLNGNLLYLSDGRDIKLSAERYPSAIMERTLSGVVTHQSR